MQKFQLEQISRSKEAKMYLAFKTYVQNRDQISIRCPFFLPPSVLRIHKRKTTKFPSSRYTRYPSGR